MAADPAPMSLKVFSIAFSGIGLIVLPFFPTAAVSALGVDGSWDAAHHVKYSPMRLMRESLGVSDADIMTAACTTAGVYALLMLADALSWCMPTIKWPASWRCDNTQCYDDMFCEPTRAALVRRPGNVYSNALYLFAALLILPMAYRPPPSPAAAPLFMSADLIFGAMLLSLALLSTIWHASNAPSSQYAPRPLSPTST